MWCEVEHIRPIGWGQIFKHLSIYLVDELVLHCVDFKVIFMGFKQASDNDMRFIFYKDHSEMMLWRWERSGETDQETLATTAHPEDDVGVNSPLTNVSCFHLLSCLLGKAPSPCYVLYVESIARLWVTDNLPLLDQYRSRQVKTVRQCLLEMQSRVCWGYEADSMRCWPQESRCSPPEPQELVPVGSTSPYLHFPFLCFLIPVPLVDSAMCNMHGCKELTWGII